MKPPFQKSLQPEENRFAKITRYERAIRARGFTWVAGVDEAGRGCLAGPVVAAACILPPDLYLEGIDDSKKLTVEQREYFFSKLKEDPRVLYGVGIVGAEIIDQINILQATLRAMVEAVVCLEIQPDYLLIDGGTLPQTPIPAEGIIRGDSQSQSIMAAAIVAKCTRDHLMIEHHKLFPAYGFNEHKGYGTQKHRDALQKQGPCPLHRRSFKCVV